MNRLPRCTVVAFAVSLAVLVNSCATNPATGEKDFVLMSEDQEIAMGRQADPQVRKEYGVYPDQALQRSHEALSLAQELAHPVSLAQALFFAAWVHQFRREWHLTQERAEATIDLGAEQGSAVLVAGGMILRGWALAQRYAEPGAEQEQREAGIAQMQQGLTAWRATGAAVFQP